MNQDSNMWRDSEHSNEHLGFITVGSFIDQLSKN
jgi:hypothetical protein